MTSSSLHSGLLTLVRGLETTVPWKMLRRIHRVIPMFALLLLYPSPAVSTTSPKPVTGLYETLRSTPVYSSPREDSQRVTTIESGLEILVVNVQGDWLEVRSRHGRGSGFIRRENAKFVKALRPPKVLATFPIKEAPITITAESAEALIQLPTRQSSAVESPHLNVETPPGATVSAVSEDELRLLKEATQGAGRPAKERSPSAIQSPDFAPYLEMIKRRVESVWDYPEGIPGKHQVSLVFVLNRGGKLVRAEVLDATHSKLDQGVLEAVRKASPFPPIPESLKDLAGWPLRIKFTIDFGVSVAKRAGQATGRKGEEVHRETYREPASDVAEYVMLSNTGAKWVYNFEREVTTTRKFLGRQWKKPKQVKGTLTITNQGTRSFEGKNAILFVWKYDQPRASYSFNYYLIASPKGITLLGEEFQSSKAFVKTTYNPPKFYGKNPLKIGATWSYSGVAVSSGYKTASTSFTETRSILRRETVTVPAGSFEALKLVWLQPRGRTTTEWWAKGIGLVKTVRPSSNFVAELISYSIPTESPKVVGRQQPKTGPELSQKQATSKEIDKEENRSWRPGVQAASGIRQRETDALNVGNEADLVPATQISGQSELNTQSQSGVRWRILNMARFCSTKPKNIEVEGHVSPSLDLSNDEVAKDVLYAGMTYAVNNCYARPHTIRVLLNDRKGTTADVEGHFSGTIRGRGWDRIGKIMRGERTGPLGLYFYRNNFAEEAKRLTKKWGAKDFPKTLERWRNGLIKDTIWKIVDPEVCKRRRLPFMHLLVVGVFVPASTDLVDEQAAKSLLERGKQYAIENCPILTRQDSIQVKIYSPAYWKGAKNWEYNPAVSGSLRLGSAELRDYSNRPAQIRRQQADKRRREEEEKRRAEERERREAERQRVEAARRKDEQEWRNKLKAQKIAQETQKRINQEWIAKLNVKIEKLKSEEQARHEAQRRAEQPRVRAAKRVKKLTRRNAAIILKGSMSYEQLKMCYFVSAVSFLSLEKFIIEPEFVALRNKTFCNIKTAVTGIRKISETDAEVETKTTINTPPRTIKEMSTGVERLRLRLAKEASVESTTWLEGQSVSYVKKYRRWRVTFRSGNVEEIYCNVPRHRDPNASGWRDAGFRSTRDCRNASKNQIFSHTNTGSLLHKALGKLTKTFQENPFKVQGKLSFQLWDDGWRVIK